MSTTASSFYVIGGTLRSDAPSYVARRADIDLFEGLTRGEFCYVLTSRQMGKSSLMNRTADRLRAEGVTVVLLDLTSIGQNLSPEQWYDGLLQHLGWQLGLDEELEAYWQAQERLGPLQRWMGAVREVVLPWRGVQAFRHSDVQEGSTPPPERLNPRTPERPSRLVIFVDEIDVVRSLPFSTDEFFASIRHCYNSRTQHPEFGRLTFCLLGVASPADLIWDTRTTPFNIGRRIELTDFTPAEAAPLAEGLRRKEPSATALLERVLYWTGGHPYLTQRLCQAVAETPSVAEVTEVDRLCQELFLSPRARERDDNLLFVREWLLRGEADRASVLELYGQVRRGQRVADDETNPLVTLLRLSGVVQAVKGRLQVRNRIYGQVFDAAWVQANMPDAELRRQRAAYRRGLLRATAVSATILAVIAGLALTAVRQAHRADQQRWVAQEGQRALRRTLYAADMSLADQAWEAGNVGLARELLEDHRPERDGEELRGFEWRYLWQLTRRDDLFALRGHTDWTWPEFSPDGKLLASGSSDKTVRLWDLARRRQVGMLQVSDGVRSMTISPDGKILATGLLSGALVLWDLPARRLLATRKEHKDLIRGVSFSPDGRLLATASGDGTLKLWSVPAFRVVAGFRRPGARVIGLDTAAFAPDGKLVAFASDDGLITLWEVARRRVHTTFPGFEPSGSWAIAFSPDSRFLAAGGLGGGLRVWDLAAPGGRPRLAAEVAAHAGIIFGVAFSPNGKRLATASADNLVKLWAFVPPRAQPEAEKAGAALPVLQLVDTLRGHVSAAGTVRFSPDGQMLATGGAEAVVRLWRTARKRESDILTIPDLNANAVALSAHAHFLAAGRGDGAVRLWELAAPGGRPREGGTFRAHEKGVSTLALSPDGKIMLTASGDKTVELWRVALHPLRGQGREDAGGPSQRPGPNHARQGATSAGVDPGRSPAQEIGTLRGNPTAVNVAAFSRDGKTLATGGDDRTVRLWDIASRRQIATLRGHKGGIGAVAFSPDGGMVVSGGDTSMRLWRLSMQGGVPTLRSVAVHTGLGGGVSSVAFSSDGRLLASGSWDGSIRLWEQERSDARGGKPDPVVLRGHQFNVTALAFSADGKTLASGSEDFTVKLWNLATGRGMATLRGHTQGVQSLAFSADEKLLISGSIDGTVRLWRAASFAETDAPAGSRQPSR
jgi:WD40 repeat protein